MQPNANGKISAKAHLSLLACTFLEGYHFRSEAAMTCICSARLSLTTDRESEYDTGGPYLNEAY
eukprot:scaffold191279_cov23-Prasinocladus_malaysianus.AAC.1